MSSRRCRILESLALIASLVLAGCSSSAVRQTPVCNRRTFGFAEVGFAGFDCPGSDGAHGDSVDKRNAVGHGAHHQE